MAARKGEKAAALLGMQTRANSRALSHDTWSTVRSAEEAAEEPKAAAPASTEVKMVETDTTTRVGEETITTRVEARVTTTRVEAWVTTTRPEEAKVATTMADINAVHAIAEDIRDAF